MCFRMKAALASSPIHLHSPHSTRSQPSPPLPLSPSAAMSAADEISRSTNPISLTRFIMAERSQFKEATGSFAMLLQSIQLACKVSSS